MKEAQDVIRYHVCALDLEELVKVRNYVNERIAALEHLHKLHAAKDLEMGERVKYAIAFRRIPVGTEGKVIGKLTNGRVVVDFGEHHGSHEVSATEVRQCSL